MTALHTLLSATEQDVAVALKSASFRNWPQDDADLLEFFILMIDIKLGGSRVAQTDTSLGDPDVNFRSTDH